MAHDAVAKDPESITDRAREVDHNSPLLRDTSETPAATPRLLAGDATLNVTPSLSLKQTQILPSRSSTSLR
jgi:hypothetical protein